MSRPAEKHAKSAQNALSSQIINKDDQLRKQKSVSSDWEHSSMRELESKISHQEETIGSKDAQLSNLQSSMTAQQREIKKLVASNEDRLKLRDELDAMKRELEIQSRKANTADNYMRKLQASQAMEKERDSLRQELERVRSIADGAEKSRQENMALRKSNDETSRTLSQIEQDFEELRKTNKQLRLTRDSAVQQVDALTERFAQDQETIAELRDGHGETMDSFSPRENQGLEGELLESSRFEDDMYASRALIRWLRVLTLDRKTRLAALEKQNHQVSCEVADKDMKIRTLQRQLEHTEASCIDRHMTIQHLRQENSTLQTSLTQVQQGHPVEGSVHLNLVKVHSAHNCQSTEVYKRMREQLKAAEADKAKVKEDLAILHAEHEILQHDRELSSQNQFILSSSNIDLLQGSLVTMNNVSMLDGLKKESNPPNQDLAEIINAASPGRDIDSRGTAYVNVIDNSRRRSAKDEEVRPFSEHRDFRESPEHRSFINLFSKKHRANI